MAAAASAASHESGVEELGSVPQSTRAGGTREHFPDSAKGRGKAK